MCRITKSVVADVFSGVKMVEYVSAAWTPLPGACSAPQAANWTKGNGRKRREGGEDGNGKRGEGAKQVRDTGEEKRGKGGRGEEKGVPLASAPISTSVWKTVSHCESKRSQGKRVPLFYLR